MSTNRPEVGDIADVTDRSYFRQVDQDAAKPFVSEGLTGKLNGQQDVATAIPRAMPPASSRGCSSGRCRSSRRIPTRRRSISGSPGLRSSTARTSRSSPASCTPSISPSPRASGRPPNGRALGHHRPQRSARPRARVRPRDGAAVDRHHRPLALRHLRRRAADARARDLAARGRGAARSRDPAGGSSGARARRRASPARARCSGGAALRARASGRDDAAAQPAGRGAADGWRRLCGALPGGQHRPRGRRAIGSTCCAGPTGSSRSPSETSPAAGWRRRR